MHITFDEFLWKHIQTEVEVLVQVHYLKKFDQVITKSLFRNLRFLVNLISKIVTKPGGAWRVYWLGGLSGSRGVYSYVKIKMYQNNSSKLTRRDENRWIKKLFASGKMRWIILVASLLLIGLGSSLIYYFTGKNIYHKVASIYLSTLVTI